jgi:hypothetical protein
VNEKTGKLPGIFIIKIIWLCDFLVQGYEKDTPALKGPVPVHGPFARHEGNVVLKEISH